MTTTKHTNDTKRASEAPPSPRWGLESLGKRRKEFAAGEGPSRAERAAASESLGRGEVLSLAALLLLAASLMGLAGCGTLDRAYYKQVTWTNAPVVHVFTNTVVATNTVAQVTERTNVVLVTNAATGAVSGYATVEPVATNFVTLLLTNFAPVFQTNVVAVPVTNLVAKPEATIQAAGSVVNTFLPGIGSIVALALGGLYHGYRQVRNRKINEALIQ